MNTDNSVLPGNPKIWPWVILVFALVICLFIVPLPAMAASFDCKKAELPLDKLVCQTPELSKLDEQMAASYYAALVQLSPEGQRIFRDSQRQWLGATRQLCKLLLDHGQDSAVADAVACLSGSDKDRISDLNTAIRKIGPYRLMTAYITQFDPEYLSSAYGTMFPVGASNSISPSRSNKAITHVLSPGGTPGGLPGISCRRLKHNGISCCLA